MSGSRLTARFGLFGAIGVLLWSVVVLVSRSGVAAEAGNSPDSQAMAATVTATPTVVLANASQLHP